MTKNYRIKCWLSVFESVASHAKYIFIWKQISDYVLLCKYFWAYFFLTDHENKDKSTDFAKPSFVCSFLTDRILTVKRARSNEWFLCTFWTVPRIRNHTCINQGSLKYLQWMLLGECRKLLWNWKFGEVSLDCFFFRNGKE